MHTSHPWPPFYRDGTSNIRVTDPLSFVPSLPHPLVPKLGEEQRDQVKGQSFHDLIWRQEMTMKQSRVDDTEKNKERYDDVIYLLQRRLFHIELCWSRLFRSSGVQQLCLVGFYSSRCVRLMDLSLCMDDTKIATWLYCYTRINGRHHRHREPYGCARLKLVHANAAAFLSNRFRQAIIHKHKWMLRSKNESCNSTSLRHAIDSIITQL